MEDTKAFFEGFKKVAKIRWASRVLPASMLGGAALLGATGTEAQAGEVVGDVGRAGAHHVKKTREGLKAGASAVKEYTTRKYKDIKRAIQ